MTGGKINLICLRSYLIHCLGFSTSIVAILLYRQREFCGFFSAGHLLDGSVDQYLFFVCMVRRSKILISQQLQKSHLRSAVSFDEIEMIFIVGEFMQHQLFSRLTVSDCELQLYYLAKHILPKGFCPSVSRETVLQLKLKIGFQKQ